MIQLKFSDTATIIVVNLYIRSFAKIDDVKMVRIIKANKELLSKRSF